MGGGVLSILHEEGREGKRGSVRMGEKVGKGSGGALLTCHSDNT